MLNQLDKCNMIESDEEDYIWAEESMNDLPVPCYPDGVITEAWFTDYGAKKFEEEITVLCYLVNKYMGDCCHTKTVESECLSNDIMYQDDYQLIVYKC